MDRPLRAFALLLVGAILAVGAIQHSSALDRREAQVDACERGNEVRARQWVDISQDAEDARAIAGQEHDPELAAIWKRRAQMKQQRADSMVEDARGSGAQVAPGLPTLNCERLLPAVEWSPI